MDVYNVHAHYRAADTVKYCVLAAWRFYLHRTPIAFSITSRFNHEVLAGAQFLYAAPE